MCTMFLNICFVWLYMYRCEVGLEISIALWQGLHFIVYNFDSNMVFTIDLFTTYVELHYVFIIPLFREFCSIILVINCTIKLDLFGQEVCTITWCVVYNFF